MKHRIILNTLLLILITFIYMSCNNGNKIKLERSNNDLSVRIGSIDANQTGRVNLSTFYRNDSLLLKYLVNQWVGNADLNNICILPLFEILDNRRTIWWKITPKYGLSFTIIKRNEKKTYKSIIFPLSRDSGKLYLTIGDNILKMENIKISFCIYDELPACSILSKPSK